MALMLWLDGMMMMMMMMKPANIGMHSSARCCQQTCIHAVQTSDITTLLQQALLLWCATRHHSCGLKMLHINEQRRIPSTSRITCSIAMPPLQMQQQTDVSNATRYPYTTACAAFAESCTPDDTRMPSLRSAFMV
jgi:hypothetical protein